MVNNLVLAGFAALALLHAAALLLRLGLLLRLVGLLGAAALATTERGGLQGDAIGHRHLIR